MYLNRIKHNVVTKLNPLTLHVNVGLDRRKQGRIVRQTDKAATICFPFGDHKNWQVAYMLPSEVLYTIPESSNKTLIRISCALHVFFWVSWQNWLDFLYCKTSDFHRLFWCCIQNSSCLLSCKNSKMGKM